MFRVIRIVPAIALIAFACSADQRRSADSAAASGDSTGVLDSVPPLAAPAPPDTTGVPGPVVGRPAPASAGAQKAPVPPAAAKPASSKPGGTFGPKDGLHIDPARPPRDSSKPRPPMLSTQKPTSQTVATLESEVRALARATGCERTAQCRTAPIGVKGCGGPRGYIVYCPLTTDTAALFRKLGELERADREFNRRNQVVSTCEFMTPPAVGVVAGRCAAAPRTP